MKSTKHNEQLKQIVTKEFVEDLTQSFDTEQEKIDAVESLGQFHNQNQHSGNELTQTEQEELKQRIENSIDAQKSRSIFYRWGSAAAAIAILVVSSFAVWQNMNTTGIADYAKNFENVAVDGNTQLFLGLEDKIAIRSEEAEIKHLENSSEIHIDSDNTIEQDLEINQTIYNTLFVPYGKKTKIVLPDNSTIWLNSGSKFTYPAKFSGKKREVFLEGEGVFEVAENKEKPFVVITNDIEVEVLGTVFNVSAYPADENTTTALLSGSVEINFKKSFFQSETLNITPGTVAVFNRENETIRKSVEDVNKYASWRYGIFILEEEPLQNIVNKLSRYHNIEIEINGDSLAKETFSGRLEFNESVEKTLGTIGEIVDFELAVKDDRMIISEK